MGGSDRNRKARHMPENCARQAGIVYSPVLVRQDYAALTARPFKTLPLCVSYAHTLTIEAGVHLHHAESAPAKRLPGQAMLPVRLPHHSQVKVSVKDANPPALKQQLDVRPDLCPGRSSPDHLV